MRGDKLKRQCREKLKAEEEEDGQGDHSVFCPGFQKDMVPSEKGTFSEVNGPSKGHN